ncbi:MAG TPA: SAM-dependent methyltransferase [Hyphomicrobium sp.]|jgi:SAM-dependent MidA family methyltransferase
MIRDAPHAATPLARRLVERIAHEGPISVADYMQMCLQDPEHGYYRRRMAVGSAGDFVTAPEISQVFGELIGLWCAVVWQQMGAPQGVRLIELGPGRGTLMRDALRAVRLVPEFRRALRGELVESNAALERMQRTTLDDEDVPLRWIGELQRGAGPVIVIANEFLDTLPVEQWVFRDGAWRERGIGLDTTGRLAFVDRAPDTHLTPPSNVAPPRDGDVWESRDVALAGLAGQLAALGAPMAALFIDYGHAQPGLGDTLQAISEHHYTDPLQAPGEADLTSQVDFAAAARVIGAQGLACDGPIPQAEFLGRLGIIERASRLMAANPTKAAHIEADTARLLAPGGMGTRFQVIGVRSRTLPPLPALAAVDTGAGAP